MFTIRRHLMWISTKPRSEQDMSFLLNLDQGSRINISKLGERWFIEVMVDSEGFPVASANSQEEAQAIVKQIFDSLRDDVKALDLNAPAEEAEKAKAAPPVRLQA
jgi:hypothetical protein